MNDPEGRDLIKQLRAIYNDTGENSLRRVLDDIRNLGAFHYHQQDFIESLNKQGADSSVTFVQFAGMSRYTITDEIMKTIALRACGGSTKHFEDKLSEAISLAGVLSEAVDHLLVALSKERETAIFAKIGEIMTVPDFRGVTEKVNTSTARP